MCRVTSDTQTIPYLGRRQLLTMKRCTKVIREFSLLCLGPNGLRIFSSLEQYVLRLFR